jgi:maltooligosyltrehalose trehalohydrolase
MSPSVAGDRLRRKSLRRMPVGAEAHVDGSSSFRVWAPRPQQVSIAILDGSDVAHEQPMDEEPGGYRSVTVPGARPGTRYFFRVDGALLPDPASRFQPEGPFGPSQVVDPSTFAWTDHRWQGVTLDAQVVYEVHIGTFTSAGTWRSAIERLPHLAETGVTLLEIMPVAEFPGRFGWGYDGVLPYAPTRLYGTPDEFRAFVDAAHALGLGVILDVVYNHLGPDGCVLRDYAASYFTNRYENEWGDALNFDGVDAGPVREFFASNAAHWIDEYHLDGLRLDATQSIHDQSPEHILTLISRTARQAAASRRIVLVSENEPQDVRMVTPIERGGHGLDAVWNDDFHHSAIVALTGRREAYYSDYRGAPQEFVSAATRGFLFQGQRYDWQRKGRGTSADGVPLQSFVVFIENHDQVANSGDGSRLHTRTTPGRHRAITAMLLLMPGTPMLFQGQEFNSSAPFLYFADHKPALAAAVRRGRAEFVSQFPSLGSAEVQARLPAPDDPETFARCALRWEERQSHAATLRLHQDLIAMRRTDAAFRQSSADSVAGAVIADQAWVLRFGGAVPADERLLVINLGPDIVCGSIAEPLVAPPAAHVWKMRWSSEHPDYHGFGTPEVVGDAGWRIPGHAAIVLHPVNDVAERGGSR